jgi:hypothetical protein
VANISGFLWSLPARLWRLVTTPYLPAPACDSFMPRAQTQEQPRAVVTVAVLTSRTRAFEASVTHRLPWPSSAPAQGLLKRAALPRPSA